MPTIEQLKELQSKSLEEKIQISTARIIEWYETYEGMVYVSFSGGKDSTVLLDLVRRIYPDVPAVFSDTGLEYPELREFVKTVENVTWCKPKRSFPQILKDNGYPLLSKEISLYIRQVQHPTEKNTTTIRLRMEGINSKGNKVKIGEIPQKWKYLKDAPFYMSEHCCTEMKKNPLRNYEKESHRKPYIGTQTNESRNRKERWLKQGCNAFDNNNPQSTPLAFWTEQDILHYIKKYNLAYASVYGELTESNGLLKFSGCDRTGCVFCGFGCHMEKEPNRFQKLAKTHPKLYDYCMRGGKYENGKWIPDKGLGMAKVLDYINVKWWNDEETKDKYREEYQLKEEEEKGND